MAQNEIYKGKFISAKVHGEEEPVFGVLDQYIIRGPSGEYDRIKLYLYNEGYQKIRIIKDVFGEKPKNTFDIVSTETFTQHLKDWRKALEYRKNTQDYIVSEDWGSRLDYLNDIIDQLEKELKAEQQLF